MKKRLLVFLSIFLCLVSTMASSDTATTLHTPWDIPLGSTLEEVARLVYEKTGATFSFNPDGEGPMLITSDLPEAQAMGEPATILFSFGEDGKLQGYFHVYFQNAIDAYASPFSGPIANKDEGIAVCQESFEKFSQMTEDYIAAYGPLTGGQYLLDGHLDVRSARADMETTMNDVGNIFSCEAELDNIILSFECYLDNNDGTDMVFVYVNIEYLG